MSLWVVLSITLAGGALLGVLLFLVTPLFARCFLLAGAGLARGDGGQSVSGCAYCGANGDTKLVRDHVVPRSRGGPDNAFNIVMACEPCNSDKRDSTALEWLGDRCPAAVKQIEDRVNRKLKTDFSKRDKKPSPHKSRFAPQPTLYAFTIGEHGFLEYIGEVISEGDTMIRMEVTDAICMMAGLWQLSGELKDVPKSAARIFNDMQACVMSAERFMVPIEHFRQKAKAK